MMRYSLNEFRALRSIFNYHVAEHDDDSSTDFIYPSQIYAIITKLGRNDEERSRMQTSLAAYQEQQHPQRRDPSSSTAARVSAEVLPAHSSSDSSTIATMQTKESKVALQIVTDVPVGCIAFDSFASIIDHGRQTTNADDDDEYQLHFLYIVNEYQTRCDSEGNYLLADAFMNHLATLRKEEEDRVVSIVNSELANDLAKLKEAHEKQLDEFTQNWDEYLTRFEQQAQLYISEMQQTHKQQLQSLRRKLTDEIGSKPKKLSRDLINVRKSLQKFSEQQLYHEAQQLKEVTDELHAKEEASMNSQFDSLLNAKMRNLEKLQKGEMSALKKRIETKRREVDKRRDEDTAKLVQRNKNIGKMLTAKNKLECSNVASDIRRRIKRVLKQS